MNKAELIKHEIEKRRIHNLAIGNPLFAAMAEEDIDLLCFIDSLQEEPVSKDLEKENKIKILADIIFNAAKHGYMPYDTQDEYCAMEIAKRNIDKFIVPKKQEEPVSEELEEELSKLLKECEVDAEYVHQDFLHIVASHFADWQKQKMMANAVDVTIHIDAEGYPYTPEIELYDYDKDVPLAKEGDKYKVVLIKEE